MYIYVLYTRPITGKQLDQNGFWRTELYILYSIQRPDTYTSTLLIFFYAYYIPVTLLYGGVVHSEKFPGCGGGRGVAVRVSNLGPTYLATGGLTHKYGTPHPMSSNILIIPHVAGSINCFCLFFSQSSSAVVTFHL